MLSRPIGHKIKGRAQDPVTLYYGKQTIFKCFSIQPPSEVETLRHDVGSIAGVKLLYDPQALLSKGEVDRTLSRTARNCSCSLSWKVTSSRTQRLFQQLTF